MSNWKTSSDEPTVTTDGAHYSRPMMLDVETVTGRVEVQRLKSDETTWTPLVGGVLTDSGEYQIARVNGSKLRIVALGDAKYFARGA